MLDASWNIDRDFISNLANNVASLVRENYAIWIITSWAVASGRYILWENTSSLETTLFKQICSSVGQAIIMETYRKVFETLWILIGQALVTQSTFKIESERKNFKDVIIWLLQLWVIPIFNENDVLSSEEIVFSDNDSLAKEIWILLHATKVIILSDVEWLFNKHPNKWWIRIPFVHEITDTTYSYVDDETSRFWRWGMGSKINTASALMHAWIPLHLACGKQENILLKIMNWDDVGTRFEAK